MLAFDQGRYGQAVEELTPLANQADPLGRTASRYLSLAQQRLGLAALQAGRLDDAERHLRHAMRASPQARNTTLGDPAAGGHGGLLSPLAAALARAGRFDRCAAVLEDALAADGRDPEAWRRLAQAQWRAGDRVRAHMTLATALRRLGDQPELHLQQGLLLAAEGRLPEAREALVRAAAHERELPEAHYYLALAAAARGDLLTAVRSLQRVVELQPDGLTATYQLALAARAARQAGYEVVVRLPAPSQPARPACGLAQCILDEPDLVDALLPEDGRPGGPNEEDAQALEAILEATGSALADHPARADLHRRHSIVLDRLGRTAEAVDSARRAVQADPACAQGWAQLGRLCARQQDRQAALDHLTRAVACGGDWPDLHRLIAELLVALGRPQQAAVHLRRALQLNPRYGPAAAALARLQSATDRSPGASSAQAA